MCEELQKLRNLNENFLLLVFFLEIKLNEILTLLMRHRSQRVVHKNNVVIASKRAV